MPISRCHMQRSSLGLILSSSHNLGGVSLLPLGQRLDGLCQVLLLSSSSKIDEIINLVFCEFGRHLEGLCFGGVFLH